MFRFSVAGDERRAIAQLDSIFGSYHQNEGGKVVSLELSHSSKVGVPLSSADVSELLADLPHLNRVNLAERQVDDEVLAHLGRLANLQSLTLTNATAISEKGLSQLLSCKQLKTLYLPACGLTDESPESKSATGMLQARI